MSIIMTMRSPIFGVASPNASGIAQTAGAQRDAIIHEHDAATWANKAWEHDSVPSWRWAISNPDNPRYAPLEAQRKAMAEASAQHDADFLTFARAHR